VLLESCLADKLAFVERNRRLIRKVVEARVEKEWPPRPMLPKFTSCKERLKELASRRLAYANRRVFFCSPIQLILTHALATPANPLDPSLLQKELLAAAAAKAAAKQLAKETAAKRNALASSESPASVVFETATTWELRGVGCSSEALRRTGKGVSRPFHHGKTGEGESVAGG